MDNKVRIRTIRGVIEYIHETDPESQISHNYIRQLVITGKVKSTRSGTKYLVNLDSVLDYLANPPADEEKNLESIYGKLRRVGG